MSPWKECAPLEAHQSLIVVEMPRPTTVTIAGGTDNTLLVSFSDTKQRDAALSAFRSAMEQTK
jgi:hypothetical protein